MANLFDWGFWIALSALLVGAGNFLDKYHFNKKDKSKAQEALMEFFFLIEERKVPDFTRYISYPFIMLRSRFGYLVFALLFLPISYVITVTTSYIGRFALGKPVEDSYLRYAAFWLGDPNAAFWGIVVAFTFSIGFCSTVFVGRILRKWNLASGNRPFLFVKALLVLFGSLFFGTLGLTLLGNFGLFHIGGGMSLADMDIVRLFSINEIDEYEKLVGSPFIVEIPSTLPLLLDLRFAYILSAIASAPALIGVFLIAATSLIWFFIIGMRWTLLKSLDATSSPAESPFAYASTLIALIALFAKVIYEFTR